MTTSVSRSVRNVAVSLSNKLFHNKVRPDINALYNAHHALAATRCLVKGPRSTPEAKMLARKWRQGGFVIARTTLTETRVRQIASQVDALLTRGHPMVTPATETFPCTVTRDCLRVCPDIGAFLDVDFLGVLRSFLRSEVQLTRTELYRLHVHSGQPDGSWLWHFDNVPRQIVKAMIYLTDTWEDTGAFRLIARTKSRQLQRRGFWNRWDVGGLTGELDDPKNFTVVEGPAGTIVFFSGHYCIHRAGPPRRLFRDVIVFTFEPSLSDFDRTLPKACASGAIEFAYHANPFTGRPLKGTD